MVFVVPDGTVTIDPAYFQEHTMFSAVGLYAIVSIPHTVKRIEDGAFQMFTSITAVVFRDPPTDGVQMLQSIGESAFAGLKHLAAVTVPDSVTHINSWAFHNCTQLKTLTFGPNSKLSTIYSGAFCNSGLQQLNVPHSCTVFGPHVFDGCAALEDFRLPTEVQVIPPQLFRGCEMLKTVAIPARVGYIGEGAFENCRCLREIVLPWRAIISNVGFIGPRAFKGCTAVTRVSFHADPVYETADRSNLFLRKVASLQPTLNLSPRLAIEASCFEGCTSLVDVELPIGISTLKSCAFKGCTSLESFWCPTGVVDMAVDTFAACTALYHLSFNTDSGRLVFNITDGNLRAIGGGDERGLSRIHLKLKPRNSDRTILGQHTWHLKIWDQIKYDVYFPVIWARHSAMVTLPPPEGRTMGTELQPIKIKRGNLPLLPKELWSIILKFLYDSMTSKYASAEEFKI